MLFLAAPFAYGLALFVAVLFFGALARTVAPKPQSRGGILRAPSKGRRIAARALFAAGVAGVALFAGPPFVAAYQKAAFEETLRLALVDAVSEVDPRVGRSLADGSLAPSSLPGLVFGAGWQAGLEQASADSWRAYAETTVEALRHIETRRNWKACAQILRDGSNLELSEISDTGVLSERMISLQALDISHRRAARDYEPADYQRVFSRVALDVLEHGEARRADMRYFLLMSLGDGLREPELKRACVWGIATYRRALDESDRDLATFFSNSVRL